MLLNFLQYLEQCTGSNLIVLLSWKLDHISIIVNVLALLLQNESLKELGQDPIRSEEFDATTVLCDGQYLGQQPPRAAQPGHQMETYGARASNHPTRAW
jgi:hypothetical protein